MKFFNTAGPMQPDIHYCLPPLDRLDREEVLSLVDQRKYFVLHAPRQTGKTSCLLALVEELNASGRYRAVYANVEPAQAMRENVGEALRVVLSRLAGAGERILGDDLPRRRMSAILAERGNDALGALLSEWSRSHPRPLVLMLDEIDSLVGDSLISVLRQLRAGYAERPEGFPQSVILCGVRDVRDYRIHSSAEKTIITGGSAFNIKSESLRLGNFTLDEIKRLYRQHTDETGQVFEDDVFPLVWELTGGQPWLVNALAYEICFRKGPGRDRSQPVTVELVEQAKETLILRRDTHLDQLTDKLKEERVQRVIEPMLAGEDLEEKVSTDNTQYVLDLGLIRRGPNGPEIANAIYREIIPRELTAIQQMNFEARERTAWYVAPDGRLDIPKLLEAFQQFFREHSEHWVERFDYKEAGPQLLMQAFLQRIVNGGGRIEREYGLGRKRTDLLIIWPWGERQIQRTVLELKVVTSNPEKTIADGLAQTADYMDRCGTDDGHLILFDRRLGRSWDDKIFRRTEARGRHSIEVWGM